MSPSQALFLRLPHPESREKIDSLANLSLIGRGGCGKVYKTELSGNNVNTIAIKEIEITEGDNIPVNKMRQI